MKRMTLGLALMALFGVLGCSQPIGPEKGSATTPTDDHGHDHSHDNHQRDHTVEGHTHGEGPHGGTIADWGGGEYHVEFTVDHDKQQATVYILGTDEKTPTSITSESVELSILDPQFQVTLSPSPQENDPEGKASRFVGTDKKLGVVQEFAGTMTAVVDGTPYSGDFKEEAHGEHEH